MFDKNKWLMRTPKYSDVSIATIQRAYINVY